MEHIDGSILGSHRNDGRVRLIDLERHRDRYLATIPDYGAITEKSFHAKAAASSLAQTEQILKGYLTNSMVSNARNDLAERETTRSLLLTEAESGMRDGGLTPQINTSRSFAHRRIRLAV